jgi:hypothetical protein
MSAGVYVTGTDTGIGKTHASVRLLQALRRRGLRASGMKPVASGCRATPPGLRNEDAEALIAASDPAPAYSDCNPCALAEPIAPHIAARRSDAEILLAPLCEAYRRIARDADRSRPATPARPRCAGRRAWPRCHWPAASCPRRATRARAAHAAACSWPGSCRRRCRCR